MKLKKQILIVEDNLLNREMLTEILKERYTIFKAENGEEALEILRQNKGGIALILLDIMMPVMDGYTFLERIKKDAELSLIPVVVMTQSGSEEDEVSALEHGATDFVPKPYRPRVILNRIESIIKLRETSAMVNQFQYDRLTRLYSKEYFYQKAGELLLENPDRKYCILCSDVENFKLYNDAFGVQAGDRILREIAEIFRNVVGETGFCGRFGDDRFLSIQEWESVHRVRKLFDYIGEDIFNNMKNVTMRWGVYEITDPTMPVEKMCDRALLAANSIKGKYNQYFAVYDDELRNKLLREKAITDAMETALTEEQFEIYLQPKYNLKDKRMVGAEALARWIHPENGFVSPGEFIPLFEKNGFIPKLDQYVWERVCAQLKDWREKGYQLPVMSVNVSRFDVYQLDLVDTLSEMIKKYDIDPTYLHLEITESAYSEDPEQIISTVEELRKLGFIVEMDDFGSGYSSLNMLSRVKLDVLKLDMKFIQNEVAKSEQQSIINDIIRMAHRMNLSVVAEGVETREQMERLQSMECDYAQGFFFAKPMSIAEFEKLWLEQAVGYTDDLINKQRNESDLCTILVVDEDDAYRDKIRKKFAEEHNILEAADAESAIKHIKTYGKEEISTVILSMTLPSDGATSVMRMMHSDPAFWDIPILATISRRDTMEVSPFVLEADDFLCKGHPISDLCRRVRLLSDITMLRKRELILQEEACRDYLTGLFNRRGFKMAVDSLRTEDFPLAVCLFDLDDLKKVNDTYGHETGDRMLRTFAEHISRHTRTTDIRCRYGGDEFAVIMKKIGDEQAAIKKGTEICSALHKCALEENLSCLSSCGIALWSSDDEMLENVIERADKALYRAKQENKGNCCLWEE